MEVNRDTSLHIGNENDQFIDDIGNLSFIGHLSVVIKVFRAINLDRFYFIEVIVKVIMGTYHFLLTFVDFSHCLEMAIIVNFSYLLFFN